MQAAVAEVFVIIVMTVMMVVMIIACMGRTMQFVAVLVRVSRPQVDCLCNAFEPGEEDSGEYGYDHGSGHGSRYSGSI